jgi:hypothetical protein
VSLILILVPTVAPSPWWVVHFTPATSEGAKIVGNIWTQWRADSDYGIAPPGSRTVNTEPFPGSLITVTSPPIMRASLREMARPSPVPP